MKKLTGILLALLLTTNLAFASGYSYIVNQDDLGIWAHVTQNSLQVIPVNDGEVVSKTNPLSVEIYPLISTSNSTTVTLDANGVFTGEPDCTNGYGIIYVSVFSDQTSTTNGLQIQQSSDGTNWDFLDEYTITSSNGKNFSIPPFTRFTRVVYTNGDVAQGEFRLQTIFKADGLDSSHKIQDPIVDEDDATLVKAVISGEDEAGVFRNAKVNSNGNLSVTDFLLEASRGNVEGVSIERKFGSIEAIQSATPANVWAYGITAGAEQYTFSPVGSANIDRMSSDDPSDNGLIVTVIGLDATGNIIEQTIALDGTDATEPVALPIALWRINRAFNANGIEFLGNIYVFVDGATTGGIPADVTGVRAYVPIGEGQTLQAIYTVPLGKTAFVIGLESSLTKAGGASPVGGNFRGRTRGLGKVFRTQDDFDLISSGSSNKTYNFGVPLPFPELTDFITDVDVTANGAGASWAFTIILIDN